MYNYNKCTHIFGDEIFSRQSCMAYFYFKTKERSKSLRMKPVLNFQCSTNLLNSNLSSPSHGTPQQIQIYYNLSPVALNLFLTTESSLFAVLYKYIHTLKKIILYMLCLSYMNAIVTPFLRRWGTNSPFCFLA